MREYCINTRTQTEWDQVSEIIDKEWNPSSTWDKYAEDTVIYPASGKFGDLKSAIKDEYTIVLASDWLQRDSVKQFMNMKQIPDPIADRVKQSKMNYHTAAAILCLGGFLLTIIVGVIFEALKYYHIL